MFKNKIYIPLVVGISLAFGIFLGGNLNFKNKSLLFTKNTKETKLKKLIDYIEYDYVDEVDTDSLLDQAISTMLVKLDPHSVYIPKENLQQVTENMDGEFVGIGLSFRVYRDSVAVINVLDKGPAKKAGIQDGDRILIADNDTLYGKKLLLKAKANTKKISDFVKYKKTSGVVMKSLRGISKSIANVTVYRPSEKKILNFNITRGAIPIKSVTAFYKLTNQLGYIKITRFARTTYKEFKIALDSLTSQGITSLALDLRGNSGGFMDIANKIADEFLEDKKLIVFTKDKKGKVENAFATQKGDFEKGKLYVLIDRNSASASEIVAGAIQDNDRGTIVGRRSFGKGLVQQEMDLGDGSAVRLTISRYYTPTGRSIQKPYKEKSPKNYEKDTYHRFLDGELTNKDSIKVDKKLRFTTPKGKVVYGGGGIVPDVFVPIDTLNLSFAPKIYDHLRDFAFSYVDTHRKALKNSTLENFVQKFSLSNKSLNKYISKLKLKKNLNSAEKKEFKKYFKAFVGRILFDDVGFYSITHKDDSIIKKVITLEKE